MSREENKNDLVNHQEVDSNVVKTIRKLKVHSTFKENSNHSNGGKSTADTIEEKKVSHNLKTKSQLNKTNEYNQLAKSSVININNEIKKQKSHFKKISIDSAPKINNINYVVKGMNDNKEDNKSEDSDKYSKFLNIPKDKIISRKNRPYIIPNNSVYTLTKEGFRKGKSKYVQSLLSDNNLKKIKKNIIDIIKNDNIIEKKYEQCGYGKTTFSYENFVDKNFIQSNLFLYKLEMVLMNENAVIKKNYKESFLKDEVNIYLDNIIIDNKYNTQKEIFLNNLNEAENIIKSFNFLE